jgi:hypothetical protein
VAGAAAVAEIGFSAVEGKFSIQVGQGQRGASRKKPKARPAKSGQAKWQAIAQK